MKNKLNGITQAAMALLAGSLIGTVAVTAAENQPGSPAPPGRVRSIAVAPAGVPGNPGVIRGFRLDAKQRELLQQSMQKNRQELSQLDEKMRVAQKELAQAVLAQKPDPKVVHEKADTVAKLQVEQTMVRAKIVGVLGPTLTPEQREQFENNPFAFRMLMEGPPGRPVLGTSPR